MKQVALLRGINVGGHRVKMTRLRAAFAGAGLEDVGSILASGNVVFAGTDEPPSELEARLEAHLEEGLGFPAPVFLRPLEHVEAVAGSDAVASAGEQGFNVHVIFLRDEPADDVRRRLDAVESDDDRFHVAGREVYWFRRGRMSDSPIFDDLNGLVGSAENTMRNVKTLRRLVAKFADGP